jgi:hypothetical protein
MQTAFWLVLLGFVAVGCGTVWYGMRRMREREAAEQGRLAAFMAATTGRAKMVEAAVPVPPSQPAAPGLVQLSPIGDIVATQKLLFDAAHKAGEAGEAAIAIQLYARLLARYPQSAFADQARAAAEAQKKKLAKA